MQTADNKLQTGYEVNMHEEETANFYREQRCVVWGCFRGDALPFVF